MTRRLPAALLALAGAFGCSACAARASLSRLALLEEILASRNDNDPRLDTGFEGLSPGEKSLFRERYRRTAPERRNERGTIVYLLGRAPDSHEDWDFLREAALEPPCLSLADCSRPPAAAAEAADEVTLAYPALVALRQAQRVLERSGADSKTREEALRLLRSAKDSQVPAVARMAGRIEAPPR